MYLMYVLDYERQLSLIREMTVLRKDSENWVVYYHHPFTNEMWKSYFPRAKGSHRGPKIMRTEPVPETLKDRLDMCLQSNSEENAIGLGIELSVEPQQWEQIVSIIEDHYRSYDRRQLRLFLQYLGVEKPVELFQEIGQTPEEHDLDEEQLKNLKKRTRVIRIKRFFALSA